MSKTTKKLRTLSKFARNYPIAIKDFPEEPDEGFHAIPDCEIAKKLSNAGFMTWDAYCGGDHPTCDKRTCDAKIWHITRYGRELQEQINRPNTLPCGHQGLRNLRDAGFTCQKDSCDAEFTEETVKETYFATE